MNKVDYSIKKKPAPKRDADSCYMGRNCRGPKYHVCLAGKPDTFPQLLGTARPQKGGGQALQDGNIARWARMREQNASRDKKIVEKYNAGSSMNEIVKSMTNISKDAVLKVLHEAQEAGLVEIRAKGTRILASDDRDLIVQRYGAGEAIDAVAKDMRLSNVRVAEVLREAEEDGLVKIRPRGGARRHGSDQGALVG